MIHIDFETRSAADLKAVGTYEYAADPTTDVVCMAWAIGDGEVNVWTPGQPFPPQLNTAIDEGVKVSGWNVAFERTIWNSVCIAKYDWPIVLYRQWECTMARAAACGLPQGLDAAAKALSLDITKDARGKRVMLKLAKPRRVNGGKDLVGREIVWWEDRVDLETVYAYCRVDVMVERGVHKLLPALSDREHKVWFLDQQINDRGLQIDRDLCLGAIELVEHFQSELTDELKQITMCQVTAPTEIENLKTWLAGRGVETATLDAGTVEDLLAQEQSADVRRVLEIRQLAGKSSTAKYHAMLARSERGRMRGNLRYYGAATGRWSGSGAQIQNFPRGSVADIELLCEMLKARERQGLELCYGDVIECAKSGLRGAIVAPEGKQLLVWDYAQIEARVLAWLAGETSLVEQFAAGTDVYKAFAAKVFAKPEHEVTKSERFVAKTMVLGLGYGMGAAKFRQTLANYGTEISEDFAVRAVNTYRKTFTSICRYWNDIEKSAISLTNDWSVEGSFLRYRLRSGRQMHYYKPEIKEGKLSYQACYGGGIGTESTYGGKLVENIVQATARDVLVEGMFDLEDAGIPIVATVHDEIIAESESDRLQEGIALLTKGAGWTAGLPLAVEGFTCRRYRK